MINESILALIHTDCCNSKIRPYARELGVSVNWDPDLHLCNPLAKIFKHVIRFDVGKAYPEDGVLLTNKKIVELVKEQSPKYVIWPTMTYEILEETFSEIRELGTFVVGWFFDDETRFENFSQWWIPYLDYVLTADKMSVKLYEQLGAKAFHLLVTGEPDDFGEASTSKPYDVSFVGSRYIADREDMVKMLRDNGISITTFGKGWPNGYINHNEMINIFFNSKINLCFTKAYSGTRSQIKGKIFDITMCGGFLLCEYVEGIDDFFVIGSEIECFNNYSEAIEKIIYFLHHEEERKAIACAGQLRAKNNLAQSKLIKNIFLIIETEINRKKNQPRKREANWPKMPKDILRLHAQYHFGWAKVLKKTDFGKQFWVDEYRLACKYDRVFVYSRLCLELAIIVQIRTLYKQLKTKIRENFENYL